jgi:Ca2+-binding RTX toxin-like protein
MALLKYADVVKNTSIHGLSVGGGLGSTSEGQGKIFKISLNAGEVFNFIKVNLNGVHLDAYLYDSAGLKIASSLDNSSEMLSYTPTSSADYYVHVNTTNGYNGSDLATWLTFRIGTSALTIVPEPLQSNVFGSVSGFTQAQLDSAVSTAVSGLHNQAYTDSAVSAAVSGLFTQSQLDSAVSAAAGSSSVDISSFLSNLADVDISSASHSVTFSKLKTDYTAFDTNKKVVGNALANKIVTSANSTNVSAGDGNDTVNGGAGNDTIDGGKGDDSIDGGLGNDSLNGGDGNDTINAGSGNNTVSGGKGSDSIVSGNGNDKIDAGDDSDTIISGDGNDSISCGAGNDSITAGVGADTIDGGKGDDVIVSNGANSKLSGGDDNDSISLIAIDAVVVSSVDTLDGGAGNDSLTVGGFLGNHKLIGGAGNDTLTHSDLNGSATLDGGAGSDILRSHNSLDVLTGGADSDFFNISGANGSIKITDFKSTVDKLVFTDSSTPIALDVSHFVTSITNSFVFTAADSYGYNTKTGALFHDVDGAGGVDAVQVALLGKVPLIASDILI